MSNQARDAPLSGMTVLIMGGGSGIGLASAGALVRDGATVILAGRTEEKLRTAAEGLAGTAERGGGRVRYSVCDAMVPDEVRATVEEIAERDGHLDAAVSLPAGGSITPLLLHSEESFRNDVVLTVMPPFLMIRHAAPVMARSGGGSIVAISSTVAVQSAPYFAAYAAGKGAVEALVRVAADELGGAGIRVNAVRPGLTRTEGTKAMFREDRIAKYLEQQPIARPGEPEDTAGAVRFLVGPESSWVTGQSFATDGGHTLRRFPDITPFVERLLGKEKVRRARRGEVD